MIVQPGNGDTPVATAEAALWATLAGRIEAQGAPEAVLQLRHLVRARLEEEEEPARGPRRIRFSLHQRASEYTVRYNARTGDTMAWFFDGLMERCTAGHDRDACLAAAQSVAQPPPAAEIETAEFEEEGDTAVFVARWRHVVDGVLVDGDYIQVLVNPRTAKPFGMHRRWHDVIQESVQR